MYTRCFFLNSPETSWTFWAKPLWTFFAVVASTLLDLGAGLMADMRLLHLRKSYRLSAPPHWVPSYSQLTLVISCVCLSISRSSAVLSVNPGKTCLACSLSSPLTVRVSVIPPSQKSSFPGWPTFMVNPPQYLFDLITDVDPTLSAHAADKMLCTE